MARKDWIRLTENAWYSKKGNLRLEISTFKPHNKIWWYEVIFQGNYSFKTNKLTTIRKYDDYQKAYNYVQYVMRTYPK